MVPNASVIAAGAHVDFAVGDGRDRELDCKTCRIGSYFGTVPQLGGEVGCIVGIEHRRAAARRLAGAVLAGVQCPDDAVLRPRSRDRGRAAGKCELMRGGGSSS